MAIQILGGGDDGTSTWQVDYDGVSTLGATVTGTGSRIAVILTITATSTTYSLDVTQYLNRGRTVLAGPGSVLGFTTNVPPSAIPAPVPKGQSRGYDLTSQWAA
jgi:hypothetical protein